MASKSSRLSGAERRESIVRAAVQLFSERGFRGATTRDLAASVGVSEPVLYRHFANKRALHDAILEMQSCRGPANISEALGPLMESGDDRAVFTRLAELILDWYIQNAAFARLLMFSALERQEISALFAERHMHVFYGLLIGYLERRMKARALRKTDALLAARMFTGMLVHQGMIYAIFRPGELPGGKQAIVSTAVDIFLEGMQKPRKS